MAQKSKRQSQHKQRCKITVIGEVDPYSVLLVQLMLLGVPTEEARARVLRHKREQEAKAKQEPKESEAT